MKTAKAFAAVFSALILVALLGGCGFRMQSFDSLIRPPKLSGKYQDLQDDFERTVDGNFDLLSPENGDYRSAFITFDYDSDSNEEALVFYRMSEHAVNDDENTVKLSFFNYTDNEWKQVSKFDGLGNSVDCVIFRDLNNDDKDEIIIGWKLFGSKSAMTFSVYYFGEKNVASSETFPYSSLNVFDVNGDGIDDIFTMTLDSSQPANPAAYARVYSYSRDSGDIILLGEARADGNISAYASVTPEKTDEANLIFVEAYKGEQQLITELYYWDDNERTLMAPLFDINSQSTKVSLRSNRAVSFDIDDDKRLEIPTSVEMRGASVKLTSQTAAGSAVTGDTSSLSMYYTKWVKFEGGQLKAVQYSIVNDRLGYILKIKSSWVGRLTVRGTDGIWSYYRWNDSTMQAGELLFTLASYKKGDSDSSQKYKDYETLTTSGETVFSGNITQAGRDFGVSEKLLTESLIITDFGGKNE